MTTVVTMIVLMTQDDNFHYYDGGIAATVVPYDMTMSYGTTGEQ